MVFANQFEYFSPKFMIRRGCRLCFSSGGIGIARVVDATAAMGMLTEIEPAVLHNYCRSPSAAAQPHQVRRSR